MLLIVERIINCYVLRVVHCILVSCVRVKLFRLDVIVRIQKHTRKDLAVTPLLNVQEASKVLDRQAT